MSFKKNNPLDPVSTELSVHPLKHGKPATRQENNDSPLPPQPSQLSIAYSSSIISGVNEWFDLEKSCLVSHCCCDFMRVIDIFWRQHFIVRLPIFQLLLSFCLLFYNISWASVMVESGWDVLSRVVHSVLHGQHFDQLHMWPRFFATQVYININILEAYWQHGNWAKQ